VVRLVTASGDEPGGSWHERGGAAAETAPLLESLAVLTASDRPDLDTRWLQDPGHSGLLVAVVGAISEHDTAAFSRMRHTAANAMAVALDVDAWLAAKPTAVEPSQAGSLRLRAQGWQAVTAGPASPLGAVWQELGLTSGLAARHAGSVGSVGPAGSVGPVGPVGSGGAS
jgi:hypothetical protein